MIKIIQNGMIGTVFKLKDGRCFEIKINQTNEMTDEDFNDLMKEYGSYIEPRIINDENKNGCFLIEKEEVKKQEVVEEKKEIVKKKKRK